MQNHTHKLATGALPLRAYPHAARRHNFHSSIPSIPNVQNLVIYFQLFQLFNPPTNTRFSQFRSPNLYGPPLVARYVPFDAPKPPFTSVLCGCFRLHRCRQNLISREEVLALRSSATPHLLWATTTTTAKVMANGM